MKNQAIVLLFFVVNSLSGQTNIDSLKSIAFDHSYSDTARTRALNKIAFDGFVFSNQDSALYYAQQSLDLAKSFDYKMGMGDATKTQGDASMLKGEYKVAVPYYERAITYFDEIESLKGKAAVLNNLGAAYRLSGDLKNAIEAYDYSLRVNEELGQLKTFAGTLFNIGSIYEMLDNVPKAKEYYLKSISYSEKEGGDKRNLALGLMNLATLESTEDRVLSEEYLDRALEAAKEFGDENIVADCYIKYGDYYLKENRSKAMNFYQKAQSLANGQIEMTALIKIADLQFIKGEKSVALDNYLKVYNNIEEISTKSEAAKNIYLCYKGFGDSKKALTYFEDHKALSDSLLSQAHVESFNEIQTKYETEKKELDNLNLKTQNALVTKQSNLYKFGSLVLLSFLGILGFLFYQLRKTKQVLATQNEELVKLNLTKDKFFSIIAHDLRSPMIALEGVGEVMDHYIRKNDQTKLSQLGSKVNVTVNQLTKLLDNLLSWATIQQGLVPYNPERIKVKKLVDEVVTMFEITADQKQIELTNSVPEDLVVYSDKIGLHTVIRNLVSNGLKFTKSNGKVAVSGSVRDGKGMITITDSGLGIPTTELGSLFDLKKRHSKGTDGERGTGLGLNLVKDLISVNKGSISVESTVGKGSVFSVLLPS